MPINVKDLLESGVHFGHRVSRWNPKMAPYIYGKRNLIHIINLRETVRGLIRARHFLSRVATTVEKILIVGTKRQIKNVVVSEAKRSGMPYVNERWLGGSLTNYQTIRSRLRRLEDLERMEADGSISQYSKKLISSLVREKRKIKRNLEGIREMTRLPGAAIVIDPGHEHIAVRETRKLGIPTVCILDTDCDPEVADIIIPGNDDAMRSVQVLLSNLVDGIVEGKAQYREVAAAEEKSRPRREEGDRRGGGDRDRGDRRPQQRRRDNLPPRGGGRPQGNPGTTSAPPPPQATAPAPPSSEGTESLSQAAPKEDGGITS